MSCFFRNLLTLSYAVIALACSRPETSTGKATLTGKFSGSFPVEKTFNVKVAVPNLVDGTLKQTDEYETQLETDGSFTLSIPLFRPVYAMFSINGESYGAFFLSPDKKTKIELSMKETDKVQVKIVEGQLLTKEDVDKINKSAMEFIYKVYDPNSLNGLRRDMSPEEYKEYILQWTDRQISTIVDENKDLPENLKQLLHRELKWFTYTSYLFDYENITRQLYEKERNEKELNDTIFTPVKPDEDLKPLSNQQTEDIKTYFRNPVFSKYLFVKNEALIKQNKFPVFIKETPVVNKEKLMETIVSSYKGKVVVVDFWATWCSPCMEAMKEFYPLKKDFENKNIVFVYITNVSSPKGLWEKKIQEIGGEHYYLTKEEWENISYSKRYGFNGIPTYMLFDSKGVLENKISGFPGTEQMREMIEKLN